jgi:hypothetical protein
MSNMRIFYVAIFLLCGTMNCSTFLRTPKGKIKFIDVKQEDLDRYEIYLDIPEVAKIVFIITFAIIGSYAYARALAGDGRELCFANVILVISGFATSQFSALYLKDPVTGKTVSTPQMWTRVSAKTFYDTVKKLEEEIAKS